MATTSSQLRHVRKRLSGRRLRQVLFDPLLVDQSVLVTLVYEDGTHRTRPRTPACARRILEMCRARFGWGK